MKEVLHAKLWIGTIFIAGVIQAALPVVYSEETGSSLADGGSGDSYFEVESDEELDTNEPISIPIPDPFIQPSLSQPRSRRFPSIEERIKLYMSNWYIPPCPGYDDGFVQYSYQPSTVDPNWAAVWIQEPIDTASISVNGIDSYDERNITSHVIESSITPDTAFFMDKGTMYDCSKSNKESAANNTYTKRIKFRLNMNMYCTDVTKLLVPALKHVLYDKKQFQFQEKTSDEKRIQRKLSSATKGKHAVPSQTVPYRRLDGTDSSSTSALEISKSSKRVPIILQFGDLKYSHTYRYMNVPHFKKFRSAAVSAEALDKVTATSTNCYNDRRQMLESYHGNADKNNEPVLQPIIWKLATSRHFGLLDAVLDSDTSWSEKKDMAVFMGQLTGSRDGFQKNLTDVENCLRLRRCRLVYDSANSSLVYARLTNTRGRLPDVLDGVELVSAKVPVSTLLQYKAVIMLEGNGKSMLN
jgi:hypothetical protein